MTTNSLTHVRELTDKEVASIAGGTVLGAIPGVTNHPVLPLSLFANVCAYSSAYNGTDFSGTSNNTYFSPDCRVDILGIKERKAL
jgi:hypothetical protein